MSKIAAVECIVVNVSSKTNWTFVSMTTDEGIVGWGECSLNRWEPLLVAYAGQLADDLVGRDIDELPQLVRHIPHSPGGLVAHAVRSGIEQACTDCRARASNQPVSALLGVLQRTSIPAYANINRGVVHRSPEGFANAAAAAIGAGYDVVKLAPFDGVVSDDAAITPIDARTRDGLDRIYAVRDAIGPQHELLVDCHWRFDEARTTVLLRDIEKARPYWVECPISERLENFAAIARLRADANARGIKLAGAEAITGLSQARGMCEARLYDVMMPDIKYAGGYAGMFAIAQECSRQGVAFSPHNPSGPIAHLASIHLCAVAESLLWLEHQWAETPWFESLVGGTPAPLEDGGFIVPTVAGLGATLDRSLAMSRPFVAVPRNANLDERLG